MELSQYQLEQSKRLASPVRVNASPYRSVAYKPKQPKHNDLIRSLAESLNKSTKESIFGSPHRSWRFNKFIWLCTQNYRHLLASTIRKQLATNFLNY